MELIKNEEVTEIRPLVTTSKWDVVLRGNNVVRLDIIDSEHAVWYKEAQVRDVVPSLMLKILPEAELDKKTTQVLAEWRWRARWFDRFIFRTKEKSLIRWVRINHKRLLKIQKEAQEEPDRIEQVKKALELP